MTRTEMFLSGVTTGTVKQFRVAETIKVKAQVCRHCGHDIPIELTEELPSEPAPDDLPADTKDWTWS